MLLHELLQGKRLVLASKSPRRRELLKGLDVEFEIWDTNHDDEEPFLANLPLADVPVYLAKQKATHLADRLDDSTILITCDTIVICCNQILGKPKDEADARRILSALSNKSHTVITGVCLKSKNSERVFDAATEVHFKRLSMEEIDYYINRYKPYDKAGAYGVQEWIGYVGVERIDGSYFNVMGLPIHTLHSQLISFINSLSK
ncbi:Maf family nucleotide pyrophosphatase [Tenuifilum sp.]|uniref:Maf family nucleotide pyrophosphatase n=1 Tax=Tenuifilum sp. TaxID=2760880 RepID=UPI002C0C87A7|nr:Maf family nucleotide pyrophosphatase [Tenuifilum sp.]HPP89620.1 Maf family nucleotide pyrophosphatase [Tenuifilum sp.]